MKTPAAAGFAIAWRTAAMAAVMVLGTLWGEPPRPLAVMSGEPGRIAQRKEEESR